MKQILKHCNKGGFAGHCARRRLKLMAGAWLLLLIAATLCVATGETAGVVSGLLLAVAPVAFALPDGVDFSENEKKGLKALADHFTEQFDRFAKGKLSEEEAISKMGEKLKAWADENGISKEKLQKMEDSLKEQGKALTALKERANSQPSANGLKGAFMKHFDELAKAVKEQRSGYSIKAVSEHTAGDIETTGNTVSTTTDAQLYESVKENPNLFLKRRGRQYIRDIANVTTVEEVPEVLTFMEEGDEKGTIAVVDENGLKPQVNLKLVKNQVEAKKAAGYIVVTEELMKWRKRAWAAVQRLFSDKVMRDYENLLTSQMLTNASSYISTALDDTIAEPTDFDALVAAILQLESLEFQPDVLVLNPADKWRLALTQTNNGMFILPYIQQGGQFGLLGLRVITTTKVEAGTFILGESGTWFIEEEAPQLRTGLVNDDLIHNRMTIVGELFFLSYVPSNNAGSFIKAKFADVKEALKAPAAAPSA